MTNLTKKAIAISISQNIITNVSPFAAREGERISICPHPEKLRYITQYTVTDCEKDVLFAIEDHLFATSRQLHFFLLNKGYDIKNIKRALDNLFKGGYINKIRFETDTSASSYKVYFISYRRGGPLFKSLFGRNPRRVGYAEKITNVKTIKRFLAVNQFKSNISETKPFLFNGSIIEKRNFFYSFPIRIYGSFIYDNETYICEAIRRGDNEEETREKLTRFYKLMRSTKNTTPEIALPLNLILICEDREHVEAIKRIAKVIFKGVSNLTYTFDMEIFDDKSFVGLSEAS